LQDNEHMLANKTNFVNIGSHRSAEADQKKITRKQKMHGSQSRSSDFSCSLVARQSIS